MMLNKILLGAVALAALVGYEVDAQSFNSQPKIDGLRVNNVVHSTKYISGRWYMSMYNGGTLNGTTATFTSNTTLFAPLMVDGPVAFDAIGLRTATGQANSGWYVGIYDVDPATCNPTNLLVSGTTMLSTATSTSDTIVSLTTLFRPVVGKMYAIGGIVSASTTPATVLAYGNAELVTQQANRCGHTSPNITTSSSPLLLRATGGTPALGLSSTIPSSTLTGGLTSGHPKFVLRAR